MLIFYFTKILTELLWKLVVPNLATGQEVNTDILLKIAGQGAVYVRVMEPYTITYSDTDSESKARMTQMALNSGD